jgi:hypothetical protein
MTAMDFWAGVLLGAATVIACYELCDALFRHQAYRVEAKEGEVWMWRYMGVRLETSAARSAAPVPAYTREAEKARSGVWR